METFDSIRSRRTLKVLADPSQPFAECDEDVAVALRDVIAAAGHAPYHYPADESHRSGELDSVVPWRIHALESSACRQLILWSEGAGITAGKINSMLAAAVSCSLVTWLPDPPADERGFQEFEPTLRNMEHIAASSAAVQNLLLAATDRGFTTYWSSGGSLRSEAVFDRIGIPRGEVLLGAIFLFPSDVGDASTKPGALRDRRGPVESWARVLGADQLR